MSGSSSLACPGDGKLADKGVGTGDEIIMALIPRRFGDLSDEIKEEARELDFDFDFDFGSSRVRLEGRDFSIFFGVGVRCGGGGEANGDGGGISAGLMPAAFAASCSIT